MSTAAGDRDEGLVSFGTGDLAVLVAPHAGARLHSIRAFGHEVLRSPADLARYDDDPIYWGAFHMAPWANRISGPAVTVAGRVARPEPSFPDGSAIHGQVHARPWQRRAPDIFGVRGGGEQGWPWTYDVRLQLGVTGTTLRLDYALTNTGDTVMPAGLGLHPWFVEPLLVGIPSDTAYADNTRWQPRPEAVTGALDVRRARLLAPGLDAAWGDLSGDVVTLAWPGLGLRARLDVETGDVGRAVVVAANPAYLDGTAVEVQTHGVQGLRRLAEGLPHALALVAPRRSLRLTVTVSFARL